MKKKSLLIVIAVLLVAAMIAGCGTASGSTDDAGTAEAATTEESTDTAAATEQQDRTYYYVAPYMGHPYVYDHFLGFKYAAEEFGVKIVQSGPDDFDTQAATEAFEQAIAKKPDGIITVMWDGSLVSAAKSAMEQGIPVIIIEATVPDHGASSYIGLDNYQCGVDTAQELINIAGDSGKLILQGNWGASNTDAKLAGVKDCLAGTSWEVLAEVNDEAEAQKSIEVAKAAMNNYPDATAFLGLDSASGPGIAAAMEELNKEPDALTVVCNDREDMTLEYVEMGYLDSTLCNKTAMQAYMAIAMLEDYYRFGLDNVPISADNKAANVSVFPTVVTTGTFTITADNVTEFKHENMDTYDTDLYVS